MAQIIDRNQVQELLKEQRARLVEVLPSYWAFARLKL